MKLFSLLVLYKSPDGKTRLLRAAHDLSSFGYFQRGSAEEFKKFTARVITERTETAKRVSVKEQEYMAHAYVREDNLTGVLVSDQEFPGRVAHTLLNKVLDDFSKAVHSNTWASLQEGTANYTELSALLAKYQNPKEADALTKLQQELDETKIILYGTFQSLLKRGEDMDRLVAQSEDLSVQSRALYTTVRRGNACCSYL